MDQIFTIYSGLFLATALVAFFTAFLAWQRRYVKVSSDLVRLTIATGIWAFILIFETSAPSMERKILWSQIGYIPATVTPVLYLIFTLRFTGHERFLSRRNILLLFIIPAITVASGFTNELHHLLWSGFSPIDSRTNMMEYYHGEWFWIGYAAYVYFLMIWATVFLFRFILNKKQIYRNQAWTIIIGIAFPWTASILYLSGMNLTPGLDLVPISTMLSTVLFVYAILYNRFLEMVPIARGILLETMADGILVLDHLNRIQDINQAASGYLNCSGKNVIGQNINFLSNTQSVLINAVLDPITGKKVQILQEKQLKTISVESQLIKTYQGSRLIVLKDITEQIVYQKDILNRDRLLDAIAQSVSILVQGNEIEKSINQALEKIGKATDVNRVYIFQNHEEDGYAMPLRSQRYEWVDGTVTPQIGNESLQNIPYEEVCPRWFDILSEGELVMGNVSDFPDAEKEILEAQDIKSILVAPIFIDTLFWGYIGFDHCTGEGAWPLSQQRILAAAANTIGAAYLRKKSQEELILAKEKAEQSDKLKSSFLANMSHEIRTPMNGILGFAELLKDPDLEPFEREKYINVIETSGIRMLNLLNDIVDLSKIESGQMTIIKTEFPIQEMMEFHLHFFKPETDAKNFELSCSCHLGDQNIILNSDKEKVYAVLTNLLKNAIKYTMKGSIEFGVNKNGAFYEFYVKDSGIGIPDEFIRSIFKRFVQVNNPATPVTHGFGLGLAISKAYIEMLGGEIWVKTREQGGSIFSFTLPII